MKATDLQIGDWVQNPLGAIGWVKDVRLFPKEGDGFGGYYVIDIAFSKNGDSYARLEEKDIKPIRLTPEILEKNGFTCDGNIATLLERDDSLHINWKCKYSFFTSLVELKNMTTDEKVKVLCYSIHELQHAFRLCGISKEIEL